MVVVPTRRPKATCTESSVLLTTPLVETLFRAKRMLPSTAPVSWATHSSAVDRATTFSRIVRASDSVMMLIVFFPRSDQPSERAVLMTLMPSKRVVGDPWLTAETWLG